MLHFWQIVIAMRPTFWGAYSMLLPSIAAMFSYVSFNILKHKLTRSLMLNFVQYKSLNFHIRRRSGFVLRSVLLAISNVSLRRSSCI